MRERVGFTIVELLIAVTVIAILAGVSIVGYNGVVQRGRVAAVSTALKDASGKLKLVKFDNRVYPTTGNLASAGVTDGNGVTYQYTSTDGSTYCLTATNQNVSYKITPDGIAAAGACAGHGVNGAPAITNLASNPSAETNITGSSGYFSAPITRDTTSGASGVASYATTTNSTTNRQGIIVPVTTAALPNQQYTCSMAISGAAGTAVSVSGRVATSADGYLSEGHGSQAATLSSTWTRYTMQFTTPASTGILRLQVVLGTAATGVVIKADAVMCTTGSTVYQYADGNTANWDWTSTPNNSASSGPPL